MMKRFAVWLTFGLMVVSMAQADTIYEFAGTYHNPFGDGYFPASFSLTVPSPPVADATFLPGPELVCNGCDAVFFYIDAMAHGLTPSPSDAIAYDIGGPPGQVFFYFAPGDINTNGTHSSILLTGYNDATLTVSGAPTSVPEPSVVLMVGFALAGVVGIARRRR